MRHQYTPVFREFTTSSMWAKDPATRCVWLYMMLHADPEGFIPGTIPGIAVASNVSLDDTRRAIAEFMAPDPDSNTQASEGRRLEKVPHGWRILNFVYWRGLAKTEGEKARKRKWAHKKRSENDNDAPDDVYTSTHVDASSETVDAPKPKPKPKPKPISSEGDDPPSPPVIRVRPVVKDLDGWEPSDELRAEAAIAGITKLDDRIASLRSGPIGGQRGVFADDIDNYIRAFFGQWRTWEETDRAKDAQRQAVAASPRSFGGGKGPALVLEPNARLVAYARKHGVDLDSIVKGVLDDDIPNTLGLGRAKEMLGERLAIAVKQKTRGHPVTGRLTPQQKAEWGSPRTGGDIPEVA